MAFIEKFEKENINFKRKHDSAETTYSSGIVNDETIFQINMYGSDTRQDKGKVSQVIQLNRKSAEELVMLLKSTFNI